ncbi:MAG TPA: DUF2442 domain-containing protein [Longimicrobium sp.]|jgi:hypothetical protein
MPSRAHGYHEPTDAEIEEARERAVREALIEPRAASARYDAATGRIVVELTNGCLFGFVPTERELLTTATPEQLAAVEVDLGGEGLRWEEIDADLSVPGTIAHRLNLAAWAPKFMGQRTSEAKSAAARANGAKGGRPKRDAA